MRPGHTPQLHTTAGIPHSFEVFYAATVRRTLTTAIQKTDEPTIARRATQDAYAVMLAQWPDRQSRAQQDNARSVVTLAAQTAADLSHRQGRSTALPTRDDRGEPPDGTHVEPYWFDIRDGLQELVTRTDSPSPLPHTLASVLLIDNHPRWRQAIAARLIQLGARTIHEAATLAKARARALATGPRDLAILDLELPDGSGVELITELRRHGWPRIVVLTSTDDPDTAHAALQAGAQAYLLKPACPPIATDNPHPVSEGDAYADRTIMPVLAIATQVSTPYHNAHQLTARQLQVLQLVADGQSNKEIGHTLNLSPLTVKTHLSHIGEKLGLSDRVQMVARAIRAGLIH